MWLHQPEFQIIIGYPGHIKKGKDDKIIPWKVIFEVLSIDTQYCKSLVKIAQDKNDCSSNRYTNTPDDKLESNWRYFALLVIGGEAQ